MRNKLLDRIQLFSAAVLMAVLLCAFLSDRRQAESNERPWQVRAYIDNYLYLAREIEQYNGIPVPLTLAVAGLESQWGRSELARNANNHFGLKIKPGWKGHEYCKNTQEYQGRQQAVNIWACFRKYPLIRRSYQDFAHFLEQEERYQHLKELEADDYQGWAEGLQNAGYATDPNYAQKLQGLIWKYRLAEFKAK